MNRVERTNKRVKRNSQKRSSFFEMFKGAKKKRVRTHNLYGAPPVMVRTATVGQTLDSKNIRKSRRNKRRFDLSLPTSGVEMQLPSIPVVRVGWRIFSLALALLLGYVLYSFWTNPRYQIETIQVSGLQRIQQSQVEKIVELNGEKIFAVNKAQLTERLSDTFPEFSKVLVGVELPNSVFITVTERIPVLIWSQNGRSEFVDETGEAFPIRSSANDTGNYPIVEANNDPPSVGNQDLQNQAQLLALSIPGLISSDDVVLSNKAKALLTPEMVKAIMLLASKTPSGAKIIFDDAHGLSWKFNHGLEVYFGQPQNIDEKILVYQSIKKYIKEQGEKPAMISVEFVHAPYYRLR